MSIYPEDEALDALLDKELMLSLGIFSNDDDADEESGEQTVSQPIAERFVSGEPLLPSDIVPFLPHGIGDEHAMGMRTFLYDLDWICCSSGFPGLLQNYSIRMSYGYIFPIAKKYVCFDIETTSRMMFPESYLDSEDARRFYMRHPECIGKLWANVSMYLSTQSPGFDDNVAAISTFFYLAQRAWLDVIELSSIALMRSCSTQFARRGEFSGIVRTVRQIEAEVLAQSFYECRK